MCGISETIAPFYVILPFYISLMNLYMRCGCLFLTQSKTKRIIFLWNYLIFPILFAYLNKSQNRLKIHIVCLYN